MVRTAVTFGMPAIWISSGMVMLRSISSADWPVLCVTTSTNGGTGSGYASMFKTRKLATPPSSTATSSTRISTRCRSAKDTMVFMKR